MHNLEELLISSGVARAAMIKYSDCEIINHKLAERISFAPKSVCIGIIPYYTKYCDNKRTVSSYALAEDYHMLLSEIGHRALELFSKKHPSSHAAFYGDHSPINEKKAAAGAGLGIIGKHSLLITPEYSSYVFICELITDIEFDGNPCELKFCENCGACSNKCPGFLRNECECLSEITQKKHNLTDPEINLIKQYKTAWGCDICQEVCPHTKTARSSGTLYTDNSWFYKNIIFEPSETTINSNEFKNRAYSWRGKQTILRNIEILKESDN